MKLTAFLIAGFVIGYVIRSVMAFTDSRGTDDYKFFLESILIRIFNNGCPPCVPVSVPPGTAGDFELRGVYCWFCRSKELDTESVENSGLIIHKKNCLWSSLGNWVETLPPGKRVTPRIGYAEKANSETEG